MIGGEQVIVMNKNDGKIHVFMLIKDRGEGGNKKAVKGIDFFESY